MTKIVNLHTTNNKDTLQEILGQFLLCFEELEILDDTPDLVVSIVVGEDNLIDLVINPDTIDPLKILGALDIARQNVINSIYLNGE